MPGSMTDGDPVAALALREGMRRLSEHVDTPLLPELRYFSIPANGDSEWDQEYHGREIHSDDDERILDGDDVEIGWRPGHYTFSSGSGGQSFDFSPPEPSDAKSPSLHYLRAIHEFLRVAYD